MCKLGGGANRCEAHWGPTQKAADLARRRAKYAAKKGGEVKYYRPRDSINTTTGELKEVLAKATDKPEVDVTSFKVKAINLSNSVLLDPEGNLQEGLLSDTGNISAVPELGITTAELSGELVDNDYYSSVTVDGAANWANLNEESYRAFGFKSIDERRGQPKVDYVSLGAKETDIMTPDERQAIQLFTGEAHEHINNALYNRSLNNRVCYPGNEEVEGIPWDLDPGDMTPEVLENITQHIDSGMATTSGQQRIVYRGLAKEKFHTYGSHIAEAFETFELGQEMVFDGYQSSSYSPYVAGDFSTAFSDHPTSKGVVLEILTSSGVNIVNNSHYDTEKEVLLPRNARYMVVGKHANVDYKLYRNDGDETDKSGVYVIQLVEITETGDVASVSNRPAPPPPLTATQKNV